MGTSSMHASLLIQVRTKKPRRLACGASDRTSCKAPLQEDIVLDGIADVIAVSQKQIAEQMPAIEVKSKKISGIRVLQRITEDDAIAEFIRSDFPDFSGTGTFTIVCALWSRSHGQKTSARPSTDALCCLCAIMRFESLPAVSPLGIFTDSRSFLTLLKDRCRSRC